MRLTILAVVPFMMAFATSAEAHHKSWHQIPPGHMKKIYTPDVVVPATVEFVCVVTTEVDGDPYSAVIGSTWLPRDEAETMVERGDSFIIYHPSVNTERGCISF